MITLQDLLGYWLTQAQRCHALAFETVLHEHCKALGKPYVINPPQWSVLSLLFANSELTVGLLARQMGVDAPIITHTVGRLEQCDLVKRHHDRKDRRVVKVSLTQQGRELFASLGPVAEAFNEQLLGSSQEQQAFIKQLHHLMADLSKFVPGGADRFGLAPAFWKEYEQEMDASQQDDKTQ